MFDIRDFKIDDIAVIRNNILKEMDNIDDLFQNNGCIKILEVDQEIIAFGKVVLLKKNIANLDYIIVKKEYQRQGYGRMLLLALEHYLAILNVKTIYPITKTFQREVNGILYNSDYYLFLVNCGYQTIDNISHYYLDLMKFNIKTDLLEHEITLRKQNIKIELYDQNKHHGFHDLFISLEDDSLEEIVAQNLTKINPDDIFVAAYRDMIIGWCGPISKQNQEGYFYEIDVTPCYRNRGIGSILFNRMLEKLKIMGAQYLHLFLPNNSEIKNITTNAGMRITETLAVLKKELK